MPWSQWASQKKRSIKKIGAFFIGAAGYGKYAVFGRDPAKDAAPPRARPVLCRACNGGETVLSGDTHHRGICRSGPDMAQGYCRLP